MLLVVQVPIFARALDTRHAAELKAAGAGTVVTANVEAGTSLATHILLHLGGVHLSLCQMWVLSFSLGWCIHWAMVGAGP